MDNYTLTAAAAKVISSVLKSGKNVEIRRKGDGYVILSVDKKIEYRA